MITVFSTVPQACPLSNAAQWKMWDKQADCIKSDTKNTQSSDACNSKDTQHILHDRYAYAYAYAIWPMVCAISVNIWTMQTRSHFGKLNVYSKFYSPSEHLRVLFNGRVALHLLDVTIRNSYIFTAFCGSKRDHWTFQLSLVQNLLDKSARKSCCQSSPKVTRN
jgi:hypothetical protein